MISFLVRTDVHISDRAPESRVDDYLEATLGKLEKIGELARTLKVTAVLDNGDFFHSKAATKNSHALVRRVAEVHSAYPCPVYENPGNHDFPYSNVDFIDRQPLGVLFATGVFGRMTDITFEDEDLKVRVVGFPYKPEFTVEEFDIERGDEDFLIVAAHTFASPKGGEAFGREIALSYEHLAECTPDCFIFGHWHIDQGIKEFGGKTFVNLGSLTRGSLTHDNLNRIPRIGYLRLEKVDGVVQFHHEAIEMEVRPAGEIFDLETHARLKEEQEDIDRFIQTLVASSGEDTDADVEKAILALDVYEQDVRERALQYLAQAVE